MIRKYYCKGGFFILKINGDRMRKDVSEEIAKDVSEVFKNKAIIWSTPDTFLYQGFLIRVEEKGGDFKTALKGLESFLMLRKEE